MTVTITDITPDFFRLWEAAEATSREEQRRLWYALYEERHHGLFSRCGDRHGTPAALPAALTRFPGIVPLLPQTIARVRAALERTGPELGKLFALDQLASRWVLLVGMFWSDGWVVDVDGQRTGFIAVEMLAAAPPFRTEILLAHEAAHVAHAACLGPGWDELTTLGHGLFLEGLATLASARLVPGHDEATYLWTGLERTQQRKLTMAEWLEACAAAWPSARARLRDHLHETDPASSAPYFLGDRAPPELPERVGYFAGYRLVSALAREHPIAELARWPAERIDKEVARTVERAVTDPPSKVSGSHNFLMP